MKRIAFITTLTAWLQRRVLKHTGNKAGADRAEKLLRSDPQKHTQKLLATASIGGTMHIDLTDNKPITPEMAAAVAAAYVLERRTGADRRDHTRCGGRRAVDHKPTRSEEIDRIVRHENREE